MCGAQYREALNAGAVATGAKIKPGDPGKPGEAPRYAADLERSSTCSAPRHAVPLRSD